MNHSSIREEHLIPKIAANLRRSVEDLDLDAAVVIINQDPEESAGQRNDDAKVDLDERSILKRLHVLVKDRHVRAVERLDFSESNFDATRDCSEYEPFAGYFSKVDHEVPSVKLQD